jgi:uncharacterized membrane protein
MTKRSSDSYHHNESFTVTYDYDANGNIVLILPDGEIRVTREQAEALVSALVVAMKDDLG